MPSLTHYKQVFSKSVILFLLLGSFIAILADFQTHFGFEHITFSYFVLHPLMILRHIFEALLASLVVPFFIAAIYYGISNSRKLKTIRGLIIGTSVLLLIFHIIVLYRYAHIPHAMY